MFHGELLFMLLGRWVAPEGVAIIAETLEVSVEIVTALRGQDWSTLSAAEKRRAAVESVASLIDERLDEVTPDPFGWSDLSEARRDRIVEGLVEITLFVCEMRDTSRRDRSKSRLGILERLRSAVSNRRSLDG